MRNFVYPALLMQDEQDGGFVVTFPDVPEAITQGEDVSDALQQAADCLEEAIAGRIRRQACIPTVSPGRPDCYSVPLPAQTAAKAALYLAVRQTGMTPGEIAVRPHCDAEEIRRLPDPRHASKLSRLEAALTALGQRLVVGVQASGVA